MATHDQLMKSIRARKSAEKFGYGILTADRHVTNVIDAIGMDRCYRHACGRGVSFGDALEKARGTLAYSNEDTTTDGATRLDSLKAIEVNGQEYDLPKNTLMTFQHILTTPRKDRDGDILRTEGAEVDPRMLLLWQHVHTLPIGKMVAVKEHSADRLSLVTSIVDMNQLCHDAAVMIDNGMGRFSHGFRAIEWEDLKEDPDKGASGPCGFDIKRFEIMEGSLVSVPSNRDAEVEDVMLSLITSGKLTSPLMKDYGKSLKELKPVSMTVQYKETIGQYSREIGASNTASFKEVFDLTVEKGKNNGDDQQTEEERPSSGASAEKESDPGSKDYEGQTGDPEGVKRAALEGSWEWIEKKLCSQVDRFLELSGAVSMRNRMSWIAGTFSDHAIVCAEHYECGIEDEFLFFRLEWEMGDDGEPRFVGQPQEVDIVTTVEVIERSPLMSSKSLVRYISTPASKAASWDESAAVVRLRAWAGVDDETPTNESWIKYRRGFAWVSGDPQSLESYKYCHHDVVDGELVVVREALSGSIDAISSVDSGLSPEDQRSVFSHLSKHYEVFDEASPEIKLADSRRDASFYRAKTKLEDALGDLEEIASGRLTERASAALGRTALDKLTAILSMHCGDDGETGDSLEMDAAKAMGIFLAQAGAEERSKMHTILGVMKCNDESSRLATELGCFVG